MIDSIVCSPVEASPPSRPDFCTNWAGALRGSVCKRRGNWYVAKGREVWPTSRQHQRADDSWKRVTFITANSLPTSMSGPLTSVCRPTYALYPYLSLLIG